MYLDKYWQFDKSVFCPFCKTKGLWHDTGPNMEANFYCKKCDSGLLIIGDVHVTNGHKERTAIDAYRMGG